MSKIICNNNFNDLKIGPEPREIMILRAFGETEYNHARTDSSVESVILHATDWYEFSKQFQEKLTKGQTGRFNPEITYNFFTGRAAIYNKILQLLLTATTLEELGVIESQSNPEKFDIIDKFLLQNQNTGVISEELREEIDSLLDKASETSHHELQYKEFGPVYRTHRLPELVRTQLEHTGKHAPAHVIVLVGDVEVRNFLKNRGKDLLGQIQSKSDQGTALAEYRRKIYRAAADNVSAHQNTFPEAYKELNNKHERE